MERADYNVEFAHLYLNQNLEWTVGPEQRESVRRALQLSRMLAGDGSSVALSLLVDDYSEVRSPLAPEALPSQEIADALRQSGLAPQFIMPESALTTVAEDLIELLPPAALYETDEGLFLSTRTRDPLLWSSSDYSPEREFVEIFLQRRSSESQQDGSQANGAQTRTTSLLLLKSSGQGEIRYSCPMLTACWHLARLGIAPFSSAAESLRRVDDGPFFASRLVTVLPSYYIKIEAAAMEIIMLARAKRVRRCKDSLEYLFF